MRPNTKILKVQQMKKVKKFQLTNVFESNGLCISMNIESNIDKSMFFDNIKSNNFNISEKKLCPFIFMRKISHRIQIFMLSHFWGNFEKIFGHYCHQSLALDYIFFNQNLLNITQIIKAELIYSQAPIYSCYME